MPKKTKKVKGWCCYQPVTKELWSAWPDKDLAIQDSRNGVKELILPCLITYQLPSPKPKKK